MIDTDEITDEVIDKLLNLGVVSIPRSQKKYPKAWAKLEADMDAVRDARNGPFTIDILHVIDSDYSSRLFVLTETDMLDPSNAGAAHALLCFTATKDGLH